MGDFESFFAATQKAKSVSLVAILFSAHAQPDGSYACLIMISRTKGMFWDTVWFEANSLKKKLF